MENIRNLRYWLEKYDDVKPDFFLKRHLKRGLNKDESVQNYLDRYKEELENRLERFSIEKDKNLFEWEQDEINKRLSINLLVKYI